VAQGPARLKEAAKLGFTRAIVPEAARAEAGEPGLKVTDVASLANLVADIAARGSRGTGGKTRGQDGVTAPCRPAIHGAHRTASSGQSHGAP
jgi:hypothetical protein